MGTTTYASLHRSAQVIVGSRSVHTGLGLYGRSRGPGRLSVHAIYAIDHKGLSWPTIARRKLKKNLFFPIDIYPDFISNPVNLNLKGDQVRV